MLIRFFFACRCLALVSIYFLPKRELKLIVGPQRVLLPGVHFLTVSLSCSAESLNSCLHLGVANSIAVHYQGAKWGSAWGILGNLFQVREEQRHHTGGPSETEGFPRHPEAHCFLVLALEPPFPGFCWALVATIWAACCSWRCPFL